ncbi:hypothetical protein BDV06DRAFT_184949 [Aspergillus oleicola]
MSHAMHGRRYAKVSVFVFVTLLRTPDTSEVLAQPRAYGGKWLHSKRTSSQPIALNRLHHNTEKTSRTQALAQEKNDAA